MQIIIINPEIVFPDHNRTTKDLERIAKEDKLIEIKPLPAGFRLPEKRGLLSSYEYILIDGNHRRNAAAIHSAHYPLCIIEDISDICIHPGLRNSLWKYFETNEEIEETKQAMIREALKRDVNSPNY